MSAVYRIAEDVLTSSSQWDRALSSGLIRTGLGASFGIIFSVLLFKRRAWPVLFGAGFGAGRAWEEADGKRYYICVEGYGADDECSKLQKR